MSLETQLFALIKQEKHPAALAFLTGNENIDINAINERGSSFFLAAIQCQENDKERYLFIEKVLSRPDFIHANTPRNQATLAPFAIALRSDEPKLVELILRHKEAKAIQVVFNKDELLYEMQAMLVQVSVSGVRHRLEEKRKILALLLEEAVFYAIENDDTSILERLDAAGAKLYNPLEEDILPIDLAQAKQKPKTLQWLAHYTAKHIASSATGILAAGLVQREFEEEEKALASAHTSAMLSHMSGFRFYEPSAEELEDGADVKAAKAKAAKNAGKDSSGRGCSIQ